MSWRSRGKHCGDGSEGARGPFPRVGRQGPTAGGGGARAADQPDGAVEPDELTLGTDNGPAFTSRRFRQRLGELGVTHRRGGYRDPESQAFIESWFGKLKQRLVWRSEFETLDQARKENAVYIQSYHHRPHSGLRYRTPAEVRKTRDDGQRLIKSAA
jgi:putative transposase